MANHRESRRRILMTAVEQFLDSLDEEEAYEDAEIGVVVVACDMSYVDEEGEDMNALPYWCSDPRKFVQFGMFRLLANLAIEE